MDNRLVIRDKMGESVTTVSLSNTGCEKHQALCEPGMLSHLQCNICESCDLNKLYEALANKQRPIDRLIITPAVPQPPDTRLLDDDGISLMREMLELNFWAQYKLS